MRSLLSPKAMRLLQLLTPERVPIDQSQIEAAPVEELVRAGLAETMWSPPSIRLTRAGMAWRPSVNN